MGNAVAIPSTDPMMHKKASNALMETCLVLEFCDQGNLQVLHSPSPFLGSYFPCAGACAHTLPGRKPFCDSCSLPLCRDVLP